MHGQISDAGRYSCRAWNDAGEAVSNMDLLVLGEYFLFDYIDRKVLRSNANKNSKNG